MNKITIVLLFVGAFVLINCRSDSTKYSKKHFVNRQNKLDVCYERPDFINSCNSVKSNIRWYKDGSNCYRFVDYGCVSNASFFLTESDCLARCQEATNCVVPKCSADLSCPYGRNVDSRGCFTCQCKDPCKDKPCKAGRVCKVITLDCIHLPCFSTEKAECVANCPDLACPYGVNTTSTTCKCNDVCLDDSGKTKCNSNELCRRKNQLLFGSTRPYPMCEAYMKYWILTFTKIISKSELEIYQRLPSTYMEYLKTYLVTKYFVKDLNHFDIFKVRVSNDTESLTNKVVELSILLRAANSDEEWTYNYLIENMPKSVSFFKGVTYRIDSIRTNNCTIAQASFKAKNIQTSTGDKEEENNEGEEKSDEDEKNDEEDKSDEDENSDKEEKSDEDEKNDEEEKSDEDEKSDEEEKSNEEEKNNDEEEKSDEEDNDEKEITLLNRHQWN